MQEEYLDNSIELASFIETEFKTTGKRKSRGVKQAGLYVLAYTYMPSVLVELGFLTNKNEEDYLNSKKGKQVMTKSLFNAIKKYIDIRYQSNSSIIAITEGVDDSEMLSSQETEPMVIDNVVFKVQIAASSNRLEPKPHNFKGLDDISRERLDGLFKYYYGYTSDYNKIKSMQEKAKTVGYSSAYIVAFKDGKQISVTDALKTAVN